MLTCSSRRDYSTLASLLIPFVASLLTFALVVSRNGCLYIAARRLDEESEITRGDVRNGRLVMCQRGVDLAGYEAGWWGTYRALSADAPVMALNWEIWSSMFRRVSVSCSTPLNKFRETGKVKPEDCQLLFDIDWEPTAAASPSASASPLLSPPPRIWLPLLPAAGDFHLTWLPKHHLIHKIPPDR